MHVARVCWARSTLAGSILLCEAWSRRSFLPPDRGSRKEPPAQGAPAPAAPPPPAGALIPTLVIHIFNTRCYIGCGLCWGLLPSDWRLCLFNISMQKPTGPQHRCLLLGIRHVGFIWTAAHGSFRTASNKTHTALCSIAEGTQLLFKAIISPVLCFFFSFLFFLFSFFFPNEN